MVSPKKWDPYRHRFRHDLIHQDLWAARDGRNRVVVARPVWAKKYRVRADSFGKHLRVMAQEGRLRKVGYVGGEQKQHHAIYEIADPGTWRLDDPTTHARRRTVAQWG